MANERGARGGMTRREFVRAAAVATASGSAAAVGCSRGSRARSGGGRRLTILQWSHFVPRYDRWFDGAYTREWGARHGIQVTVDHMTSTEVPARGAAVAAAGRGHDLFLFISPPAAYESHALDLRDVVEDVERRHGKMIDLARKSIWNPSTGRYFAFSDSYVPDPGNYRRDLWAEIGLPDGPDSWDELRTGGRRIKERFGSPVGIGLSQETDSNMALRALLWSFGGAEQDESGRVALDSKGTLEALRYVRALYREAMTPEVFTFDPSSNNRMMLAGRASFVQNGISVTRTAEKENPEIARKIGLTPALAGPVRRLAAEHIMNCYVVWKFARNPDAAKQFLIDLVGSFGDVFRESEFYNFPCYPSTVPDIQAKLESDPGADPPGKYRVLASALEWSTNVGYPGYATAAIDEAFNTFVLPTMFARVARGESSPEEALRAGARELDRIFERWRAPRR